MLDWRPNPSRARAESMALSRALAMGLGFDSTSEGVFHPAVFAANSVPYSRRPPIDLLMKLVSESRRRATSYGTAGSFQFDLEPLPELLRQGTVERAHVAAEESTGERQEFAVCEVIDDSIREGIAAAFRLVRSYWPEIEREIRVTTTCLNIFVGSRVLGFADFKTHGLIFLRRDELDDPAVCAEGIIHEASHVRFNGLLASTPCLEADDGQLYTTPLREDPRPAFGLLHQLFVVARLGAWNRRIDSAEARCKAEWAAVKLDDARATVLGLPLTAAGRQIVTSLYCRK
ncbi:hypothetical protein GCM10023170_049520 [Phytohabitans houttuyneae]